MEETQALELISRKKTILSAPGWKASSLYYTVANSMVDSVEITYNQGRYQSSLTNMSFGGQSIVILANQSFVDTVCLHLELPNLYPNQTLSRGWGYLILDQLAFLFGSSNMSQVQISGQSVWQKVAMQCENAEKRSELWRLGGEEYLQPVTHIVNGVAVRDPNAVLSADIILPLPWSSASGLFNKKAFDTNTLSNPIQIQIRFKNAEAIYGGLSNTNPFPTGFQRAVMSFRQGELSNQAMSMRNELFRKPDESMFYPFVWSQSYQPSVFAGSNDVNSPVTIPLQSFINADLLSITIAVVRTSLLSGRDAKQSPNGMQLDNIQNIVLDYNGSAMFVAPRSSWKLATMKSAIGAQYFHNSLIQPTSTGAGPYISVPQDSYLLHIDFSAIRATTFEGMMQNTWRIGNNVLNLSFNTEGDSTVAYQMFCTYNYNSVIQINQGQSIFYFD